MHALNSLIVQTNTTTTAPAVISNNTTANTITTTTTDVKLIVKSVDLNGNVINGMWTEIHNSKGQLVKSGFTPLTYFNSVAGQTYTVTIDQSYNNIHFDHWSDNGSTSSTRTVTATTTQTTLVAYYKIG